MVSVLALFTNIKCFCTEFIASATVYHYKFFVFMISISWSHELKDMFVCLPCNFLVTEEN
jgi:hypothetical protein